MVDLLELPSVVWLGTTGMRRPHSHRKESSGTWGRGDEAFPPIFCSETYVGV